MAGRRMIGTAYGLRRPDVSRGEEAAIVRGEVPRPPNKTNFIGVEIEVEGCEADHGTAARRLVLEVTRNNSNFINVWNVKRDGSLRNNGLEFVTFPIHASSLELVLTRLYDYLRGVYSEVNFSERCGIHIHMDCTLFSATQLLNFIKLYIIFENSIFNFIGDERKNSNFCVPLHNFNPSSWFDPSLLMTERILHNIPSQDNAKYSALNPCRLCDLGTLEFRHLEGTWDIQRIVTFASLIQRMKTFVLGTAADRRLAEFIATANTISNFDQFAREVFSPMWFPVIIPDGYDLKQIEIGVSQAKKFVMGLEGETQIQQAMILDVFGNEVAAKRIRAFMEKRQRNRGGGQTNRENDDMEVRIPEPAHTTLRRHAPTAQTEWWANINPTPLFTATNPAAIVEEDDFEHRPDEDER